LQLSPHMIDVLVSVLGSRSDKDKSEEEKRDMIEDIAEKNPAKFLAAVKSNLSKIIQTIKEAKEIGIIRNDIKKQQFVFMPEEDLILSTKGFDKKKIYELFAKFLLENPKMLKTIESKVLMEKDLV